VRTDVVFCNVLACYWLLLGEFGVAAAFMDHFHLAYPYGMRAPKIFYLGEGSDTEVMYQLCVILNTML